MPTYKVTRISDGQEVYQYTYDSPLDLNMFPADQYEHTEMVDPAPQIEPIFGGRRRVTKLEFVALLGTTAYVAVLGIARQSVEIEAWVKMIDMASVDDDGYSIDLDDPRTAAGVQAIETPLLALGVVTAGWAEGVLRG